MLTSITHPCTDIMPVGMGLLQVACVAHYTTLTNTTPSHIELLQHCWEAHYTFPDCLIRFDWGSLIHPSWEAYYTSLGSLLHLLGEPITPSGGGFGRVPGSDCKLVLPKEPNSWEGCGRVLGEGLGEYSHRLGKAVLAVGSD